MSGTAERLGRWTLEAMIGAGGFGQTWLGRNAAGERVAVKLLRAPPGRELIALASVVHPAIVGLIEASATPRPHLVMEYVEGTPLSRVVLSVAEAVRVVVELADGLAAAHAAEITHGDIKPDNILLRPDRSPCLVDFGASGSTASTPEWAAPERLRGRPASPASDVHSLGLVARQLLQGGDVPRWFDSLVRGMCDPDPQRRPTAEAIADRAHDRGVVVAAPGLALLAARGRRCYIPRTGERRRRQRWLREGGVLAFVGRGMGGSTALRHAALQCQAKGLSVGWGDAAADVLLVDGPGVDVSDLEARWVAVVVDEAPEGAIVVPLEPFRPSQVAQLFDAVLGWRWPSALPQAALRACEGSPGRLVAWLFEVVESGALVWHQRRWVLDRLTLEQLEVTPAVDLPPSIVERFPGVGPAEGAALLGAWAREEPLRATAGAWRLAERWQQPWLWLWTARTSKDLGRTEEAYEAAETAHLLTADLDESTTACAIAASIASLQFRQHELARSWLERAPSVSDLLTRVTARVLRASGDVDGAWDIAAPVALGPPKDVEHWLDLRVVLAQCTLVRGDPHGAVELLESVPASLGHGTRGRALLDAEMARLLFQRGSFSDAASAFDAATHDETLLPALDRARLLNNSAACHHLVGRRRRALEQWLEARVIVERLGAPGEATRIDTNLVLAWAAAGRPDRAIEVARRALSDAGEMNAHEMVAVAGINLGWVLLEEGLLEEAGQRIASMEAHAQDHGGSGHEGELACLRAELAVRRGDPEALERTRAAVAAATASADAVSLGRAYALQAVACSRTTSETAAREAAAQAVSCLEDAGLDGELASARLWMAMAFASFDRPAAEETLEAVEEAALVWDDDVLAGRVARVRESFDQDSLNGS